MAQCRSPCAVVHRMWAGEIPRAPEAASRSETCAAVMLTLLTGAVASKSTELRRSVHQRAGSSIGWRSSGVAEHAGSGARVISSARALSASCSCHSVTASTRGRGMPSSALASWLPCHHASSIQRAVRRRHGASGGRRRPGLFVPPNDPAIRRTPGHLAGRRAGRTPLGAAFGTRGGAGDRWPVVTARLQALEVR